MPGTECVTVCAWHCVSDCVCLTLCVWHCVSDSACPLFLVSVQHVSVNVCPGWGMACVPSTVCLVLPAWLCLPTVHAWFYVPGVCGTVCMHCVCGLVSVVPCVWHGVCGTARMQRRPLSLIRCWPEAA